MCVYVENCLKVDVEVRQKSWHDLEKLWPGFGSYFGGLVRIFSWQEGRKLWRDFMDQVQYSTVYELQLWHDLGNSGHDFTWIQVLFKASIFNVLDKL